MSEISVKNRFVTVLLASLRVKQLEACGSGYASTGKRNFSVMALEEIATKEISQEELLVSLKKEFSHVEKGPLEIEKKGFSARARIAEIDSQSADFNTTSNADIKV